MAEVIIKGISKYENFIIIGDFKIDIKVLNSDKYKLEYFCDLSSLPAPWHESPHAIETSLLICRANNGLVSM